MKIERVTKGVTLGPLYRITTARGYKFFIMENNNGWFDYQGADGTYYEHTGGDSPKERKASDRHLINIKGKPDFVMVLDEDEKYDEEQE